MTSMRRTLQSRFLFRATHGGAGQSLGESNRAAPNQRSNDRLWRETGPAVWSHDVRWWADRKSLAPKFELAISLRTAKALGVTVRRHCSPVQTRWSNELTFPGLGTFETCRRA